LCITSHPQFIMNYFKKVTTIIQIKILVLNNTLEDSPIPTHLFKCMKKFTILNPDIHLDSIRKVVVLEVLLLALARIINCPKIGVHE